MNKAELLKTIRNSLFNNQGTDVQSALSAAHSVIDTITDPASRIGALTAMHVVLNTVANAIEALPDPLAAPPEEIKIETVQLSVDRATLDDIIDARINRWYENDFDIQEEINDAINDYDFEDTVREIVKHNISFSIDVD
jgi:hypothetical protein